MIELSLVPWGVAIGLAVSAPLGPINFMCIRQTLRHGFRAGVFTGLGSVAGDGIFAAAAALGLKTVADIISDHAAPMQIAGGLFLLILGIHAWRTPVDPDEIAARPGPRQAVAIFGSTLLLTLTNPSTMAGFVAILAGASKTLAHSEDHGATITVVASVMAGSLLWWVFLSTVVVRFRDRLDSRRLALINRVTGAAIVLFAVFLFGRVALARFY